MSELKIGDRVTTCHGHNAVVESTYDGEYEPAARISYDDDGYPLECWNQSDLTLTPPPGPACADAEGGEQG